MSLKPNGIATLKSLTGPAWSILEYGSYPLMLFLATPWFLHQLGVEQYGHWMLLTAAIGVGCVLNSGTGAATIKSVSTANSTSGGIDIGGTAVRASVSIALIGGGGLALLVFFIFWIAGPTALSRMGDPALIQLTGAAAAVLIWLEQLDNVFSSSMKGAEHFAQAARIEITSKATQVLAVAFVVLVWPTLWALYTTLLVVAVLRLSLKVIVTKRLLKINTVRPSMAGAADILLFAKWGWLQGVGGLFFGVADRVLVGSLLGATSLAYYSIASQLAMQIHALAAAGLSVIFPMVSRKLESREKFSLWRITKISMAANLLVSSAIAILLVLFGTQVLFLWIGPAAAGPTAQVLPWLVLAYWLLALNVVPYYVLLGMGRIRFVGLTIVAAGTAGIITTYFAIVDFGLPGAAAGRGTYAVLSLILLFPLARHFSLERKERNRLRLLRGKSVPDSAPLP